MKFKVGEKYIVGISSEEGNVIEITGHEVQFECNYCSYKTIWGKEGYSSRFDENSLFGSALKPYVPERKILITTDGVTTTARLYDGKKVVRSTEAKCAPSDTFSFNTGANLAYDRLMRPEVLVKCAAPEDKVTPKTEGKPEPKPEPAKAPVDSVKLYCAKDYKPGIWLTKGKVYDLDLAKNVVTVDNGYGTKYADNLGGEPFVQYFCKLVSRPAKVGEWVYISKFINGGRKYTEGNIYKVTDLSATGPDRVLITDDDGHHGTLLWQEEYLVLDGYTEPEPKYYNGDVICINSTDLFHTVGKKYTVTDGVILSNSGCAYNANPFKTLSEFNERQPDKFIEYKE